MVSTKFIFAFYLYDNFSEFSLTQIAHAIFWGIKFDFATSAVIAFLATFFDFNKKLFAFIASSLLLSVFLTQISDILYFYESSRHIGYEIMDTLTDAQSLFMTAYLQHTTITISALIIGLILFIISFTLLKNIQTNKFTRWYFARFFVIILVSVFFVRGMFQHIPLHPWQSNEIGNSKLAAISLNSLYNIVYSVLNKSKKLHQQSIPKVDEKTMQDALATLYPESNTNSNDALIKSKPNVVFLFLESFNAIHMKSYGFEKITTPHLDKIIENSIRSKFMIANGLRTTEGIFATLTSYQNPLGATVAKSQLQNYPYSSIIDSLVNTGYSSAFFQGTSKDTSGTGSFANTLGFEKSYGKRDIKTRIYDENSWGVHDTDLYNFAYKKVTSEMKEPFVLGLNNASTHDKQLPKGFNKINFVKNQSLNKRLNTYHYADHALNEFIQKIEKQYPNTIFVIFADHCGGDTTSIFETFMVPFAIYSKKLVSPKYHDVVLSQKDIAPSLYDLILGNYKQEETGYSGKSIFSDDVFFADYFYNGTLGWIENKNLIEINTSTNKYQCYKLNKFKKEETQCQPFHQEMRNRALSYTNLSQKLLFKGKTKEFFNYRRNSN